MSINIRNIVSKMDVKQFHLFVEFAELIMHAKTKAFLFSQNIDVYFRLEILHPFIISNIIGKC